jgi:hypothetical protein
VNSEVLDYLDQVEATLDPFGGKFKSRPEPDDYFEPKSPARLALALASLFHGVNGCSNARVN